MAVRQAAGQAGWEMVGQAPGRGMSMPRPPSLPWVPRPESRQAAAKRRSPLGAEAGPGEVAAGRCQGQVWDHWHQEQQQAVGSALFLSPPAWRQPHLVAPAPSHLAPSSATMQVPSLRATRAPLGPCTAAYTVPSPPLPTRLTSTAARRRGHAGAELVAQRHGPRGTTAEAAQGTQPAAGSDSGCLTLIVGDAGGRARVLALRILTALQHHRRLGRRRA